MITSKHPIILGNAPSSGSTLLANVLGRSKSIYQRGELSAFDKPDWIDAPEEKVDKEFRIWLDKGYRRRIACENRACFTNYDQYGLSKSEISDLVRSGMSYVDIVRAFLDQARERDRKERWLEKTPANAFALTRLARAIPDAFFIGITRDARFVISSLIRRGFSPEIAVARWYLSNLALLSARDKINIELVRYEDFTRNPAETLENLFAFLNEHFDASILSQTGQVSGTTKLETWSHGVNDAISPSPEWDRSKALPPRVIDAFKRMRPSEPFLRSIDLESAPEPIELQKLLGYSTSGLEEEVSVAIPKIGLLVPAYFRYSASLARHRLSARSIPFSFVS
ncbi:sulfotransferase [Qipengyuania sp. JC766]|uniref:sulfotransferase family protein n=1 Tax=Qipengyuania sp. JC766 TaxID=3232139 RepID=UPI0034589A63